jgi:hypothetical protein
MGIPAIIRRLYEAIMGRELKRELARNAAAADALDAALREVLEQ